MRSVAETLVEEPGLKAVTIDRAQKKISLATIGQFESERLSQCISDKFKVDPGNSCKLLQGKEECHSCSVPLTPEEFSKISIVSTPTATTISRVTCPTAPSFWSWRDLPFPKVGPREIDFELDEADHDPDEWKWQLLAAILCGIFGVVAVMLPPPFKVFAFVAAYLAGGFFPAEEVWERLQHRVLDVHFLMLAVAIGSASIGAWGEGATLLFLFSFSGALEHYAMGRTQKEIRSLFRDAPKTATVLDPQGRETETAVEKLRAGVRISMKPGAQFPVDGKILKGNTAADESNLTGEAAPVEKKVGDSVLSGTMNLWGAVEVLVSRPVAESSLQKIIKLIREAQKQKAPAQQFADKFSTYYTYAILGVSLAMFFVWWLVFGLAPFHSVHESQNAFYRTMTLLVVSSPCALVLSIPSAVLAAIASAARHGILFRGGAAVEKMADINIVALDKTGTLTTGELRVEKVESFPAGREDEIVRVAYSLEKLSAHPLARAITRHGKQMGAVPIEFLQFESITGQGLRGRVQNAEYLLGRREWLAQQSPNEPIKEVPPTEAGISEVWISSGNLLGRMVLRDDIRVEAAAVMESLRQEGIRSIVLTGDHLASAEHLRVQLRLDDVRAGMKPEDKVAAIRELTQQGNKVAMVGDGVNDAPSLALAHIGVAMGARGADAALEQADVVLMNDRLENFLLAFRLSQRARSVIRQNLFISLGTVVVLVCFALAGRIPLTVGVVGHEGSTVVVVMNSLRLLLSEKKRRAHE